MYDIIKKYVENENENGLLLVDMPTGSGKTYSAIEFIYNFCMNPDNKDRKYIFVCNRYMIQPEDKDMKFGIEVEAYLEVVRRENNGYVDGEDGYEEDIRR